MPLYIVQEVLFGEKSGSSFLKIHNIFFLQVRKQDFLIFQASSGESLPSTYTRK